MGLSQIITQLITRYSPRYSTWGRVTLIHQFYYLASTRFRSQTFSIRLYNESRVGTPLCRYLVQIKYEPLLYVKVGILATAKTNYESSLMLGFGFWEFMKVALVQIWAYLPLEQSYFTKAYSYFQISRIFQKCIWRILKQLYLDVSTTKYDFKAYLQIPHDVLHRVILFILLNMPYHVKVCINTSTLKCVYVWHYRP